MEALLEHKESKQPNLLYGQAKATEGNLQKDTLKLAFEGKKNRISAKACLFIWVLSLRLTLAVQIRCEFLPVIRPQVCFRLAWLLVIQIE